MLLSGTRKNPWGIRNSLESIGTKREKSTTKKKKSLF